MTCSVGGCVNESLAKNLCAMHRRQIRKYGKVTNVLSQIHRLSDIDIDTAYCNRCGCRVTLVSLGGKLTCKISARARTVRNNIKDFSISDEIFRDEPDRCEICGDRQEIAGRKYLCYDHDHKTGKFRGWLCNRCNYLLGYGRDDPEILAKAISYLTR